MSRVLRTAGPSRASGGLWILPRWIVLTCVHPPARIRLFTLDCEPTSFWGRLCTAVVLPHSTGLPRAAPNDFAGQTLK